MTAQVSGAPGPAGASHANPWEQERVTCSEPQGLGPGPHRPRCLLCLRDAVGTSHCHSQSSCGATGCQGREKGASLARCHPRPHRKLLMLSAPGGDVQ